MPLTHYNPRAEAKQVAGNTTVVLMPAVAAFEKPEVKLTEVEAGTAIQNAIRSISVTGDPQMKSDQFLGDENEVEERGTTKWSIDPLEIAVGDPQKPDAFIDSLVNGATFYVGERYGPKKTEAFTAQHKFQKLAMVELSLSDWVPPEANADGKKFTRKVHFAVKGVKLDVPITATV